MRFGNGLGDLVDWTEACTAYAMLFILIACRIHLIMQRRLWTIKDITGSITRPKTNEPQMPSPVKQWDDQVLGKDRLDLEATGLSATTGTLELLENADKGMYDSKDQYDAPCGPWKECRASCSCGDPCRSACTPHGQS